MGNASAIRDRFRDMLGTERYGRFVRVVNEFNIADGRLRYWQQELWQRFAESEGLPTDHDHAIRQFLVCCVHSDDLQSVSLHPGPQRDPNVHIDPVPPDPGEVRARSELFPMACVRIQPNTDDSAYDVGWYCQTCKDIEYKWRTREFKRNITRSDCPVVSLYIENSAEKYPGETPWARLVCYYSRWQVPDTPHDPELLKLHDAICRARTDVLTQVPVSASLLATAAGLFSYQAGSASDRSILDHCKMHYIALNRIATAFRDEGA